MAKDAMEAPSPEEQVAALVEAAVAELATDVAAAEADATAAQADAAAAKADAAAAEAALAEAKAVAMAAEEMASKAQMAADDAAIEMDAMKAAAQGSALMVSTEQLDGNLLSLDSARVSLAGPDAIYVSSIMYDGQSYSALLRYLGGTTAVVEKVFGPAGVLIPDSVGLAQTELAFVAPNVLDISYVEVGGQGFSGQLRYAGDNRLEVAGIQRVMLPPSAADQVAELQGQLAAAQAATAEAQAAAAAAEAARVDADAVAADAQDKAMGAQDKVDMMMAEAHQPSAVMVSADQIDGSLLDLGSAQASLAGPDSVYVTNITYDGQTYSALLKYQGGTTATVEAVYGTSGKLIPDSVGLSATELAFVGDTLDISYVDVGGQGYSGQLRYAGDNRLVVAGIQRVTLPPTAAEQVAAAEAAAQAAADAAGADAQAAADAAVADAQAAADAAVAEAQAAAAAEAAAADAAVADAAAAQAEVDAMMADADQPSEVMVAAADIDPSLGSLANAQVSLAGPDRIYVSNIMYDGQTYSALLRYTGGTSATVEAVYGPMGKLIPDAVGLSQTGLTFVAPDSVEVSNVEVGGVGYTGTLQYVGNGQVQVTGIRRVTLPPTAAEQAQATVAQAEATAAAAVSAAEAAASEAQAATEAAVADAEAAQAAADGSAAETAAAQAAADASAAEAAAAQAEVDAMMADADQPSEVMVSTADIDPSLGSLANAQVSLAGPDRIYVSNIMYDGQTYSALLRYTGGTSATVEAVYGPMGKLIPDAVGLSQTGLTFVAPDSVEVSNVEVGGVGYTGTLQYVGNGQVQVTGIRQVTLPPNAAEQAQATVAQAEATAAAAVSAAEAAASEAQAATEAAVADAEAAQAAADGSAAETAAAQAAADASAAEAAAAQAEVDAMMADADQPSEVMVSTADIDPSLGSLANAQVSLAGPDRIYVSNIMYDGQTYSALLRYTGGTSATVEAVYGPMGKLIPDAVGLSQTGLTFVAPDSVEVSNVEVGGVGYTGTLQYVGNGQAQVTGIRRVTLPPTAVEQAQATVAQAEATAAAAVSAAEAAASEAQAATEAAVADAEAAQAAADGSAAETAAAQAAADASAAEAAAAQAEVDAMMADANQPSEVMVSAADIDPSLGSLANAQVSLAGPDRIYVSNIMYDGQTYSALLRYTGGTSATVEAVYGPMGKLIPDAVGLSQTGLTFVAPDSVEVSNVEVGGVGYTGTLQYVGNGQAQVTGIRQVTLPPTEAEEAQAETNRAQAENEALKATITTQAEQIAALEAALAAAEAATSEAMADAEAAQAAASEAQAAVDASAAEAAAAQAEVDAMMADADQPSEVMVAAADIDPSLGSLANAQVSLAGPDRIYVSNIMYDGQTYSALLRYTGGTSATVEAVYGPMGKLIPDAVGLSQTGLTFVAPDSVEVSNVEVGGVGYTGTLQYVGNGQVQVTGIRQVTLPPTAAEEAAAAVAQAEADASAAVSAAEAAADAAVSEAQAAADAALADAEAAQAAADGSAAEAAAAQAAADASAAEAAAAQAEVDAMMADADQPSEVMVAAADIDPSLGSLANAQVSLAGPDRIYVSNIMYDGQTYSALLRYTGGTSATVEAVYGPMGKLIPDAVGLSQTGLTFVAPDSVEVSNVEVGGVGYTGTLQYVGNGQVQVTGIRQVTLPPTAAEEAAAAVAQAEADASAAVSAAEAAADAAVSEAQAAAAAAQADAEAAQAAADGSAAEAAAAQAAVDASAAEAAAAQAEVDAMMADANQPSEVMVAAADIDPSLGSLANAQVSLAGPDRIYVSNIMYDGQVYSALLRYTGGTSATVEAVYGPMGKLIPDAVGLSQTGLTFVAPDSVEVSNVEVGGVGYTGTLQYVGNDQVQVTGIRQVALPPTEAEEAAAAVAQAEADASAAVSAAEAAADAAVSEAQADAEAAQAAADGSAAEAAAAQAAADASAAEAAAAQAEVDAMMADADQPSEVMVAAADIDPSLGSLANAQVSLAGPDRIYVSNIMYDGQVYSALLRYTGGTSATVEAVYGPMGKLIPDAVGLSQTGLTFVAPDSVEVSNVEVGGVGYTGTLQYVGNGQVQVTGIRQVTLPPTAAEEAAAAVAQAEADASAAVSAAEAAADAAVSEAQAAADAALADAEAAQAAADGSAAEAAAAQAAADASAAAAAAAQAEVDAMMADANQPSEVMVAAADIDPSLGSLANAQVSLAGPDRIYVSNIMYDGQVYSALLRYTGGTSATVEAVYGPMGKLIPDAVGLSQTGLTFVAPDSVEVSNVEVGGVGYTGTLQYVGNGQVQVTGIRQVTLPPTAAEEAAAAVAQAEADAAAAVSAAEAAADAAVSEAQAAADAALADAEAAQAAADGSAAEAAAAQAAADASAAAAAAAQAEVDAMMADANQPSEVMVAAADIDPSLGSLANAQVSLAGPDRIYVSNIMYDGQVYSALLRYTGGTSATVEAVYGPMGKLIPDAVGLSQTGLTFVAPDSVEVSNVEVGGVGYTGTLQYVGNGQVQVTGIRQVTLPPTEAEEAQAATAAAVTQAEADASAAVSAAEAAADAAVSEAQAAADAAVVDAQAAADAAVSAAMADAEAAQADAEAAQAEVDAMMADADQPSEVMVAAADIDPSLGSLANAQVSLAGPDRIYVSNIMYDGQVYSALLRYTGGTSATVEAVYGPMGKLIPDAVGLSQTGLTFVAPDSVEVSNVEVGGVGYTGTLQYVGNGQVQVTGIRQVTLPPTEAEEAQAATAAAVTQAEADASAAVSEAEAAADAAVSEAQAAADAAVVDAQAAADAAVSAAMADTEAAQADAEAAQAEVDAMMADADQPSEVMVAAADIDPSLGSLANAQVSLAGPDRIYVSNIMYDGQVYSALLRYTGGTSATVEAVYGPMGKLIPDAVGLSQTGLTFVAPDSVEVSNVEVGGVGYTGTLQYVGNGQVQVTGIRQVTLPPTEAEEAAAAVAQAEADAAAAVSAAEAAADAAVSEAQAAAGAAQADAEAAQAAADGSAAEAAAAQAAADASAAEAAAAQAEVDAMMADANQPSEVMVSTADIDPSLGSLANAQVSLAGPDRIYVSNIMYDGQTYSALLRYTGGTSATVEAVYGPMGKLIPDAVGLSQTGLTFVAPDSVEVSNVEVGGVGYTGTLQYVGNGQVQVTGIRQVTLPPTEAEEAAAAVAQAEADAAAAVSAAEAAADAAVSEAQNAADAAQADAEAAQAAADGSAAEAAAAQAAADASAAEAAAAQAEVDAMMADANQPSEVMVAAADIDPSLGSLANAQVSLAGPDRIYVSNIMYDGQVYSALLRYTGGTSATVEAVYGPMGKLIPDAVGLSQTGLTFVAPDSVEVSNVEVGGVGYTGTLQYVGNGQVQVTGIRQVTLPPTEAEEAQAATAAAVTQAEADASAAVSAAEAAADAAVSEAQAATDAAVVDAQAAADAAVSAAMADAEAAQADAEAAQAEVDAMMADANQPSEVMVAAADIDPSLGSLANAQVSLAGPDRIYVSNIMYDGQTYSALLRYTGGTSATVEAVYGPMGKLIPDAVGLSQTGLTFVAPDSVEVSNVEVGGVGYTGTLQYVGNGQVQVTGIRQVTLPPTEAEEAQAATAAAVTQAEADASAAVSAAEAAADAAVSEAQAATDAAVVDAQAAADAAVSAAMADAEAAQADAEAAQAEVDAMMADANQPSEVMVAAADIDPSLGSLANAQVSLAGPDRIYVSNIMYDGQTYSALLRYTGGTSATVEAVYGPMGKLIPDAVGLSQTGLTFVAPDSVEVSNVEVGGVGYTGTLQYVGNGQVQVTGIRQVTLPPTEVEEAQAAASAAVTQAEADASAAVSAAEAAADAAVSEAQAATDAAVVDAQAAADAAVSAAMADAEAAQAEVDAMMADAHQPSEVMVAAADIDPSLGSLANAQVSLAGPDRIYVSNIMYDGQTYSALLKYQGGTTATVEAVYGTSGKLIPDSVGLSATELAFVGDTLDISYVDVGGQGYSGQLRYAGDNRLEVAGIQRVTLPPTAAQQVSAAEAAAQAAADAAVADAQAAADAAVADAQAAEAATADAQAAASAAQAEAADAQAAAAEAMDMVDMMMAEAHQPSAVMVSADQIDGSLLDLGSAQASLAGPNSVYITNITYDGQTYSALLKYQGGTTATVEAVYGTSGKLIPDSVGLSATELAFVGDTLDISYVDVGGQGYSGQLRYAGDNRLEVAGIQRVTLPPTAAEQVSAAEAAAQAAADAAVADAQAAADAAVADAQAAEAAAADAQAAASAAQAEAADAQATAAEAMDMVDMMMAEAHQPSAVMVSADQIDGSLLDLGSAQASLAGPNSVYITNITYDGQTYSALLKYQGGTTATVEAVYGTSGKLIPDSVGLSATELAFVGDTLDISYVDVGGQGYSGQLRYAGDNRLEVTGIQRAALPPTADEQVSAAEAAADAAMADAQAAADAAMADAQAAADAAMADAQAAADAAMADAQAAADAAVANAEAAAADAMGDAEAAEADAEMAAAEAAEAQAQVAALMKQLEARVVLPAGVDSSLVDLDSAQVSIAGPDSIYISGIRYGSEEFSARLRYSGGNEGVAEALFGADADAIPDMDLSAPALDVVGADTLVISNVGISGNAYSFSLKITRDGAILISAQDQGHGVRTAAELLRDELLNSGSRVVSGFGGGNALPGEGAWGASPGGLAQTDAAASHAKFAIGGVAQPATATLYGVTARAAGDEKVGYGLHFLASDAPTSGNTWNYGQSYLMWVTQEENFYGTDETQVQLYQSLDDNRLVWLMSENVAQPLATGLTLEALYDPDDCSDMMGACNGSITLLVDGTEQFKVALASDPSEQAPDAIALRALGGPVEFTDVYVHSR